MPHATPADEPHALAPMWPVIASDLYEHLSRSALDCWQAMAEATDPMALWRAQTHWAAACSHHYVRAWRACVPPPFAAPAGLGAEFLAARLLD